MSLWVASDMWSRPWPPPCENLPRTSRLESVLRVSVALVIVAQSLLFKWQADAHQPTRYTDAAFVIMIAAAAVVVWGRLRGLATLIMGAATLMGLVGVYPPQLTLPALLLGALGYHLALDYKPAATTGLLASIGVAYVAVGVMVAGPAAAMPRLLDALTHLTFSVGLSLVATAARRGVIALDQMEQLAAPSQVAAAIKAADDDLRDEAQRVLHDDVIALLNSLADGSTLREADLGRVTGKLRARFLRTERRQTPSTPEEVLDSAIHGSGVAAVNSTPRQHWARSAVDSRVADAAVRAISEALRNAERHGRKGSATVSASFDHEHARVRVSSVDRVDTHLHLGGWGWSNSVLLPMRSVGGDATVKRNGSHTVVEVSFPVSFEKSTHSTDNRVYDETIAALGEAGSSVISVLLAYLSAHVLIAMRQVPLGPHPWLQAGIVFTLCGATVLTWRHYRYVGPLSVRGILVVMAVGAASVAVSLSAAGDESLSSYESWVIGMAGVLTTVVVFFLPIRQAALVSLPVTAVVLGHALTDSHLAFEDTAGALVATFAPMGAATLAAGLRWTHRATRRAAESAVTLSAQVHSEDSAREVDALLFSNARQSVLPFLESVDPDRPLNSADRATARLLAHEVRDDLYIPGLLDRALKARVWAARSTGAQVTFLPPSAAALPTLLVGLRVLDRALDQTGPHTKIIMAIPTTVHRQMVLTILPKLPSTDLSAQEAGLLAPLGGIPHAVVDDDYATVITIPDGGIPQLDDAP